MEQQQISERAARLAMQAAQQLAAAWATGEDTSSVDWAEIEYAVQIAQEAVKVHRADGGASLLEADDLPGRWEDPQG